MVEEIVMKSAVFYGKHDLRVEEHEMPKVGPRDVLVQIKACGVCGTDVHIYEGDKGAAEVTPPTILGHEFSGIIAEVGAEVKAYKKVTEFVSTRTAIVVPATLVETVLHISVNT